MAADAAHRARYQAAYKDLVETHKYHLLTRNQKVMVPGHINHSDDELAFLSYYPCCATRAIPRCSKSTARAWSAAGRSNGRNEIRCGM